MVDAARARKLSVRIREVVAESLRTQVKDPRLGMITLTDVKVTPDLREATVYYTVLGDAEEHVATAAALDSAKGVLRTQVGRQTGIKFTPTLSFVTDRIPDNARQIDELIDRARQADAEVQRAAANATPAGDPDPYRKVEDADGAPTRDDAS